MLSEERNRTLVRHIDVIATTISGSIADWSKVERIVPLFREHGENDIDLYVVDTHAAARKKARELVRTGSRTVISAGGSGTFNAVLEGCYETNVGLSNIRLGFLRKGSADLIGKTLHMPDDIEAAVAVFVDAVRNDHTVPCDIIEVTSERGGSPPRHFVGYAGTEIFGEIPRYTENRFMKWYKGVLSQLFGDLGPFFVGTSMSVLGRLGRQLSGRKRDWTVTVDGETAADGRFQAMIIVNGYLGPNLPFAEGVALGSGDFYMFALRDQGLLRLCGQLKHAWDGSVVTNPDKWGFERFRVQHELVLRPGDDGMFPVNVDGSTMPSRGPVRLTIVDQIQLLTGRAQVL
jgi:diacylglycerol kinase family enzyme